VPQELYVSNISTGAAGTDQSQPTALLQPTLDGEETSYFEWLGAGSLQVREVGGVMHRTDAPPAAVTLVQFGFSLDTLFVRVDGGVPMLDLLAGGRELSLKFAAPDGVRYSIRQALGRLSGRFWDRQAGEPRWIERGPGGAMFAAGTVLEVAIPLADLRLAPGQAVAFFVAVYDAGLETERHPPRLPIELVVPDARFEAHQWRA